METWKLTAHIEGVVSDSTSEPIHRATVRLAWNVLGRQDLCVVTNRAGRFRFRVPSDIGRVFLSVVDDYGKGLSETHEIVVGDHDQYDVEISLLKHVVDESERIRRLGVGSIVDVDACRLIEIAIDSSSQTIEEREANHALFSELCLTIPTFLTSSTTLDLAYGVLGGWQDDISLFSRELGLLESQTYGRAADCSPSPSERTPSINRTVTDSRDNVGVSLVCVESLYAVLAASARVCSGNSALSLHRHQLITAHIRSLWPLQLLVTSAEEALGASPQAQELFLKALHAIGKGRFPFRLNALPVGDRDPNPDGFGGWGPMGFPPECHPAEVGRALREQLGRISGYRITSITPARACPGEEITIRGSGFVFEGDPGRFVHFPGAEEGTRVPASASTWSDNEIRVIVPDGARCGMLDLDFNGRATITACDREFELAPSAFESVRFEGGATAIKSLSRSRSLHTCFDAGDDIYISWRTCNTDRVRLRIADHLGTVFEDELIDGSRGLFVFRVPELVSNRTFFVSIHAIGPCGFDDATINFTARRNRSRTIFSGLFETGRFENWHRNHVRDPIRITRPTSLSQLVDVVDAAEQTSSGLGIRGSAFSFTDIVASSRSTSLLIDTDELYRIILSSDPISGLAGIVPSALRPSIDSVLETQLAEYSAHGDVSPIETRLVHVQAGIKLAPLVCQLDRMSPRLALPTLGGGLSQSVAGAFCTGTHGSTLKLPPLSDFVRAIHLVGAGGQQWWLEPGSRPITDPDRMESLRVSGDLDPCIRIEYDDDLFYSALVAFGTPGVIHAVVLETIDAHRMSVETSGATWSHAKEQIQRVVLEERAPDRWFFEVTVNPTREARINALRLVESDTEITEDIDPPDLLHQIIDILVEFLRNLPLAVTLFSLRVLASVLNPFRIRRAVRTIRAVTRLIPGILRSLRDAIRLLRDRDDEATARILPGLLNLLRDLDFLSGSIVSPIDKVQNLFTERSRPEGTAVKESYAALTFGRHCAASSRDFPTAADSSLENVSAIERLVQSFEYVVPAERCADFVDDIFGKADEIRRGPNALLLTINIRFTQATSSKLGMQQYPKSCHVEIWTMRGLRGNSSLHSYVDTLLDRYGAFPHWGQLHPRSMDFPGLFGPKLDEWRRSIRTLANEGRGNPETFTHSFAVARGLL